jgi:hypothetical protein
MMIGLDVPSNLQEVISSISVSRVVSAGGVLFGLACLSYRNDRRLLSKSNGGIGYVS